MREFAVEQKGLAQLDKCHAGGQKKGNCLILLFCNWQHTSTIFEKQQTQITKQGK